MAKYMCVICGFVYDEAEGLPEEGIPPGTAFDDLPLNWTCPDCGARRDDFEIMPE
ncbi:MAG: rubredoxin [Gammaproteobacteria bacterium]|nr:rubredoxin [Gammaproteobacteria bacterium]